MAETTTKPRPVVKTAVVKTPIVRTETTRRPGIPLARLGGVVERASKLSDEVLKSLETGERSAIEALGQFVIAVEEALPQEVLATSEVAKKLTESGLAMTDRVVHTQHEFLRAPISSAARSLSSRNGANA